MRSLVVGLAMIAGIGVALPITAATASETVVIKKHRVEPDVVVREHRAPKVVVKRRIHDENVGFDDRRRSDRVIIKKRIDHDDD